MRIVYKPRPSAARAFALLAKGLGMPMANVLMEQEWGLNIPFISRAEVESQIEFGRRGWSGPRKLDS